MKKLIFILGSLLLSGNLFSQDQEVDVLTLRDSLVQYKNGATTSIIVPQTDGTAKIKNVADPLIDTDGANKKYVDDNSFTGFDNVIIVNQSGGYDFTDPVSACLYVAEEASEGNNYLVLLMGGTYVIGANDSILVPDYTTIRGIDNDIVTVTKTGGSIIMQLSPYDSNVSDIDFELTPTAQTCMLRVASGGVAAASNKVQGNEFKVVSDPGYGAGCVDVYSDGSYASFNNAYNRILLAYTGVSQDIDIIKIQGDVLSTFDTESIVCVTAQSSGDITLVNNNSTNTTIISSFVAQVQTPNPSYSGTVKGWSINEPNAVNKFSVNVIMTFIGASTGTGSVYGLYVGAQGTASVDLNTTTFKLFNYATEYFIWADHVNNNVNANFINVESDNTVGDGMGGNGTISKVMIENRKLKVNTAIIDENMSIPGSTNISLKDFFNIISSAGWVSGGEIIDNKNGTVNVAAGTGLIRISDDEQAEILMFNWEDSTDIALIEGDNYIYIDYNSGDPELQTTTVGSIIRGNENNKFELWEVVKENNDSLHISPHKQRMKDPTSQTQQLLYEIAPIRRTGGLIIDTLGTRQVQVSSGTLWIKLNKILIPEINTLTGEDTFDRYYRDGAGGWTVQPERTIWDNDEFDEGGGSLSIMVTGRYSYQDFYTEADRHLVSLFGQAQYNSQGEAESAPLSATAPARIADHSIHIGRIVFQKSATTGIALSAFTGAAFQVGSTSNHNELSGINGLSPYNHLGNGELTNVQNLSGTNTGDVVLNGSYDYITLSGQTITRNQVDYDTDISNRIEIVSSLLNVTGAQSIAVPAGTFSGDIVLELASGAESSVDIGYSVSGNQFYDNVLLSTANPVKPLCVKYGGIVYYLISGGGINISQTNKKY